MSAIRVNSLKQPAKSAVIFLHGLGDTGAGWKFLADEAQQLTQQPSSPYYGKFDHTRFIFPNAPVQPVTVNYGQAMPSWFDLHTLGSDNIQELLDKQQEDVSGVLSSVNTINKHIEELLDDKTAQIKPENIVVGGFSQGAALALASVVLQDRKLAGFISLSGFLRIRDELLNKVNLVGGADKLVNFSTPVLHCHGDADPVVQYKFGLYTKDFYKKELHLPNYRFLRISNMPHSVFPEELQEVYKFIANGVN